MRKWGILILVLALAGAAIFIKLKPDPQAHPILSDGMLLKEPNPVELPRQLRILSKLKIGDAEQSFAIRASNKRWLKLETTNETVIRSVVEAMRRTAHDGVPWNAPPTNVVTYHIYFELSDPKWPLYYRFYYNRKTNEPSSTSAYSTAGNLWNAEGLEAWFATNGLLPEPK